MKKRMNRLVCMLLTIVMLLGLLPTQAFAAGASTASPPTETKETTAATNPFNDVDETDWFYDGVQYARVNGFFSGTSAEKFNASGTMTRGMFVTVLGRMAGINPADYAGDSGFSDVPSSAYYAPYVNWAAKYGITTGSGDGTFSPDTIINREQMAVFFVRYFEAFGVELKTETNITTIPEDIDSVSPYARDAVLKLWKTGLLNGDGKDFNPKGNASRAQAAVVCMRTDKVVDTWYTEPGVPSTRVSVDPKAEQPAEEKPQTPTTGGSSGSGNGGGGSNTTYYEVKFAMGTGEDGTGVTLPDTKTYAANTKIISLPTPYKQNVIFLNWYYDAAMTQVVSSGDTISQNMTLYAKMADGTTMLSAQDTPRYITQTDVLAENFDFKVKASSADAVRAALTIINITETNADVAYTVSGNNIFTVTPSGLTPGQTYKAELAESSEVEFVVGGEAQGEAIRELNFITAMSETLELSLNKNITYVPAASVTNMTGTALDGLFTVSVSAQSKGVQQNKNTGTFTYAGSIAVGDTVAIYEGVSPEARTLKTENDGDVAYVTVTAKTGNVYTYETADTSDVMFTPDVLPVSVNADKDGDAENHQIKAAPEDLDFTLDRYADLGLNSQTTIDVGDYIIFYTGEFGEGATDATYACITGIAMDGEDYVISYADADESEVTAAMSIYDTREVEVEYTDTEIAAMEREIKTQAVESGFADEAAAYLTALAIETDGFRELSEDTDLDLSSYQITNADGTPLSDDELALMAGGNVKKDIDVQAAIAAGKVLQHFDGSSGVRAELSLTVTITINDKVEIKMNAIFEQEILLSLNTSGGAIWKKAWIFPYIYDYKLNANFDVGTFTGVGITATAKTIGKEDEAFDWKPVTGNKYEQKILDIGKQITDLMDAKEEFLGEKMVDDDGNEVEWAGSNGGGLAVKYANMISEAEESWIELFRQEIFSSEGQVDPFHILCYGVSADFVVEANMYITLGMTFEYAVAKRYNFSIMLFHKETTNETIDLEESHYQFDFYVMGTLGIRAGIEFEVGVGLFSLKLDSIGITAAAGVYAQLWGYFYYHLEWTKSAGKTSSYSGAMLIEIGMYLKITFKAQLFSSDKLTYQPTLYENKWPLWTIGEQNNVYDFNYESDDTSLKYDIIAIKDIPLPTSLFDMKSMDMQSGDLSGADADDEKENPAVNYDDATESHYTIKLSNPAFTYNAATNTVKVTPVNSSVKESCEMTITWKNGALAFTSKPISRTVTINWSNPADARYVYFDFGGGTSSAPITVTGGVNALIPEPAAPTKKGYVFAGWYTNNSYTTPVTFPMTLTSSIGIVAKWDPDPNNSFSVKYYQQELNGTYSEITATKENAALYPAKITGTTGLKAIDYVNGFYSGGFDVKNSVPYGFKFNEAKSTGNKVVIAADGSTVVELYFDRKEYRVHYYYYDEQVHTPYERVTRTYAYGENVYPLQLTVPGYTCTGYHYLRDNDVALSDTLIAGKGIINDSDLRLIACWTANNDTPYRVEYYVQRPNNPSTYAYDADRTVYGSGTTGSVIDFSQMKTNNTTGLKPTPVKIMVDGKDATSATIAADGTTVVKLYYDRASYQVEYMMDGQLVAQSSILYGASFGKPTEPTKTGYTFAGWYSDAAFTGEPFNFNTAIMGTGITLYAKMIPGAQTIPVEHYVMGTDGSYTLKETTSTALYKTGDVITLADLKNSTLEIAGGVAYHEAKVGSSGVVTQYTVPDSGVQTIRLYYVRSQYTLAWNLAGGTAQGDYTVAGKIYYGATITPPTVTKQGYSFSNWNQTITTMPAQDVTYTAEWNVRSDTAYQVQHYRQNANDDSYTLADTDNLKGTTGASVTATVKTYANFTLNSAAAGTVKSGTIAADGSLVLKLYYDRQTFTVTYDANGGTLGASEKQTLRHGATVTAVTNPTRSGYGFSGWFTAAEGGTQMPSVMPAKNITVYAQWAVNQRSYTVEHYVMDVNGAYPQNATKTVNKTGASGTKLTLADFKDSDCEGKVAGGITYLEARVDNKVQTTIPIPDDNTLVIKLYYQRATHTLTWNLGDGTASNAGRYTKGSVYYGAAITKPELTRTGYTYAWNAAPAATMPAQDVTYTANWTANSYKVAFNANGGTGTMSAQSFAYGTAQALSTNTFTRTGYRFLGWATSGSGSQTYTDGQSVTNLTSSSNETVTLYAVWEQKTYDIIYYLDGGTNAASNPAAYTVDDAITLQNPTKDGFDFVGWFSDAALTQAVTSIEQGSTVNKDFYAKWKEQSYTITYYLDGGTAAPANPTSYTSSDSSITLTDPTRAGYEFAGWQGTDLSGTVKSVTIPKGSSGTRTYTAIWSAITYHVTYVMTGLSANNENNPETFTAAYNALPLYAPTLTDTQAIFVGWFTAETGGEQMTSIAAGTVGNITLYPRIVTSDYVIYSQADLTKKMTDARGTYYLGSSFTLTNWTTRKFTSGPFYGTLDGRGYTITYGAGCTVCLIQQTGILYDGSNGKYGTIENLRVEGTINDNCSTDAGGIVAVNYGILKNCSCDINIYANEDWGIHDKNVLAGGLVAANYGEIIFSGSESLQDLEVRITGDNSVAGGITATNYGKIIIKDDAAFTVTTTTTARGSANESTQGGIVGASYGNITSESGCAVTVNANLSCGDAFFSADEGVMHGGLVGCLSGTNSLNGMTINVNVTEPEGWFDGGFARKCGSIAGFCNTITTLTDCTINIKSLPRPVLAMLSFPLTTSDYDKMRLYFRNMSAGSLLGYAEQEIPYSKPMLILNNCAMNNQSEAVDVSNNPVNWARYRDGYITKDSLSGATDSMYISGSGNTYNGKDWNVVTGAVSE